MKFKEYMNKFNFINIITNNTYINKNYKKKL